MGDSANNTEQIRCLISNVYDLQKLRISAGNRITTSFYISLGINPSEKLDTAEDGNKKFIDRLRQEYVKIADGVIAEGMTVNKSIKTLNKREDTALSLIRSDVDYNLVDSYMKLVESEESAIKVLDKYVKAHPMWKAFFEPIKGCGTLMSAVMLAYLDPYKARHVSSFFRYCGLDTVQDEDSEGNKLFLTKDGTFRKVRQKVLYTYKVTGENYFGKVRKTGDYDEEGNEIIITSTGEYLDSHIAMKGDSFVYEDIESGEEYIGEVVVSEHGRRKSDTEMFEYTKSDGTVGMKRGLTYNPLVKTKLMGVLSGCLLKAKDPTYSTIYYDYRARLDKSAYHKEKSDAQKNRMALRYMVKQFLRNLWTTWRELEGLPVDNPYEVEKLGNTPHKYNEYQVKVHNKQAGAEITKKLVNR